MSTFQVDPQAIDATATTLWSTTDELRVLAHRIGAALQLAGSAGGSAGLASSSAVAARRWATGLGEYAEAGLALSRATEQAGLAYVLVELHSRGRFTATVRP